MRRLPCTRAVQGGGPALAVGVLRREGVPQRLAEALCLEAGVPLDRCGPACMVWGGLDRVQVDCLF